MSELPYLTRRELLVKDYRVLAWDAFKRGDTQEQEKYSNLFFKFSSKLDRENAPRYIIWTDRVL